MIPIHDDNPTTRAPVLTLLLIAACVAAFGWFQGLDAYDRDWVALSLGIVPAIVTGHATIAGYFPELPPNASFVTMLFLHAGWLHLVGNLLYLWIFGNNVEDRLGHFRFLVLYLAAGIAGSGAHVVLNPDSEVPLIGASGAISGVLGAYLLLYPFARVRMVVPPFLFRTFTVPAWAFLVFWFVLQSIAAAGDFAMGQTTGTPEGGVAWDVHVVGFVVGALLLLRLRPSGVPLFHRKGGSGQPRTAARTRRAGQGSVPSTETHRRAPAEATRAPTVATSRTSTVARSSRRTGRTVER